MEALFSLIYASKKRKQWSNWGCHYISPLGEGFSWQTPHLSTKKTQFHIYRLCLDFEQILRTGSNLTQIFTTALNSLWQFTHRRSCYVAVLFYFVLKKINLKKKNLIEWSLQNEFEPNSAQNAVHFLWPSVKKSSFGVRHKQMEAKHALFPSCKTCWQKLKAWFARPVIPSPHQRRKEPLHFNRGKIVRK